MRPRHAHAFALAAILSALQPFSPSAFSQSKEEPVTHLDTLVVTAKTDLPPPENWLTATLPGLVIYSSAGENASKKLIAEFDTFRFAVEKTWPFGAIKPKSATNRPLTLILCGRKGFDDFIPASDRADSSKDAARAGITLTGPERAFIVIDMSASTMTLANTDFAIDMPFAGSASFEVDYHQMLCREYVHYLLNQAETPPPVWFEEGILQIIQKMEVFPKYIRIGELKSVQSGARAGGKNSGSMFSDADADGDNDDAGGDALTPGMATIPDTDFNIALQRRPLLGFKDFFGVTRDSPEARNPIGNNLWAKQCHAFVHLCLYALPNRHKNALETLVTRSAKEPLTEQLFAECFGKTYKKFLIELRGYIDFTTYQYIQYNVTGKELIEPLPFELTPAKEADAAATKADALMLAGNPVAALPALRGAYGRGERSPNFLAAYGLAAHATKQTDLARRLLSQAITATPKTTRAAAYPAYAALLLDEAKAHPGASDGSHITPAQTATILNVLFAAREFHPALPQTYREIAAAWLACEVAPKPENFAVIKEGLALFPDDAELLHLAARVTLRMSDTRATAALIERGLKTSPDAATRARFDALKPELAKIPPDKK